MQSLISQFGDRVQILGDNAGMHLMVKIDTEQITYEIASEEFAQAPSLTKLDFVQLYN